MTQPFERPEGALGEGASGAVLVHLKFPDGHYDEDAKEFSELALSAGAQPVAFVSGSRSVPDAKFFVGKGKVDEVRDIVASEKIQLAIFNHSLSPSQERNLERHLQCRVLDRTGLILDIFAQRARTHEGKLQVELAQLQHLSTRLVRGWSHLERQRGGIGLRGPGETQLETDRRLLGNRIKSIKNKLTKVRAQREQGRRARKRAGVLTVSLVGYTNAGKSTLFNTLTSSNVYAAGKLFATLDPTLRRLELPTIGSVVLADTVGFIRQLPHDLVDAFRATLEETQRADLLLHVVDAHSPYRRDLIAHVNDVLAEIGAEKVPQLQVFNKIDLIEGERAHVDQDDGVPHRVWVSALRDSGLHLVREAIVVLLGKRVIEKRIHVTPENAKFRAQLYELGAVQSEEVDDKGGWYIVIRIQRSDYNRLLK